MLELEPPGKKASTRLLYFFSLLFSPFTLPLSYLNLPLQSNPITPLLFLFRTAPPRQFHRQISPSLCLPRAHLSPTSDDALKITFPVCPPSVVVSSSPTVDQTPRSLGNLPCQHAIHWRRLWTSQQLLLKPLPPPSGPPPPAPSSRTSPLHHLCLERPRRS
jgi:hypothetical protein